PSAPPSPLCSRSSGRFVGAFAVASLRLTVTGRFRYVSEKPARVSVRGHDTNFLRSPLLNGLRQATPNPALQRTRAGGRRVGPSRTPASGRPERLWNGTGR